jgi:hypothetical protein
MTRVLIVLGALLAALVFTVVPNLGRQADPAEAIILVCDDSVLSTVAGTWQGTATDSMLGSESVTLNVTRTQNRRFEIQATAQAQGMTLTATSEATISDSCNLDANGSGPLISQFHIHGSVQPAVGESAALIFGKYEVKYVNGGTSSGNITMRKAGRGQD